MSQFVPIPTDFMVRRPDSTLHVSWQLFRCFVTRMQVCYEVLCLMKHIQGYQLSATCLSQPYVFILIVRLSILDYYRMQDRVEIRRLSLSLTFFSSSALQIKPRPRNCPSCTTCHLYCPVGHFLVIWKPSWNAWPFTCTSRRCHKCAA